MNSTPRVHFCDPQNTTTQHSLQDSPTPPPELQSYEVAPRFVLGQEVFILDNKGTDPTGLSTYLVLSNWEKNAAGQVLYRLMPSQEVVFRAAESRLMEVKFMLGAQVRRTNDTVAAVVTRRFVVDGVRLYDLRDEVGRWIRGIKESELEVDDKGSFPFVTHMR